MATKKQAHTVAEAGLAAAVAAAGAGAYWLYGAKDASKHRKMAKSWMLKARGEVLEGVEKLKDIDKEKYLQIVDTVMKRYKKTSGVTAAEAAHITKNFKDSWQHIQKEAKETLTSGRTSVRQTKPAKKTAKKAKKYVKKR